MQSVYINICRYVYVYMYIYIYIYMHICTYMSECVLVHAYLSTNRLRYDFDPCSAQALKCSRCRPAEHQELAEISAYTRILEKIGSLNEP